MLTKPPGSLGQLELVAERFAAWQGKTHPSVEHIAVVVFAGDHGVCAQGVSAFPQAVTTQMLMNFLSGGAAISVLSRSLSADFSVVNMGTVDALPAEFAQHPQLDTVNIAPSTQDFTQSAAMTSEQVTQALAAGQAKVAGLCANKMIQPQLFVAGEMGIGNTTSASAIYSALLSIETAAAVGPGTGLDNEGLSRKQAAINTALALHTPLLSAAPTAAAKAYEVLRCLGGFEIAALTGSYIACAQQGIPVVVDGFIGTAAALVAVRLNPSVREWMLFSHRSAEPAHQAALTELNAQPLLDLGLRLGEGSGAALAVPLIQSALALHQEMATFSQAGVSDNNESL